MKRVLFGAIALLVVINGCKEREAAPAPATQTVSEIAPAAAPETAAPTPVDHDVTGGYFAIDPLPADFAELNFLSLATIDENAAPAPLNGFLRPKELSAADYKLIAPKIEGNRLTFTTAEVNGVSYAFDGTFAQLARFPENPPDAEAAVLSGTLTKTRGGKPAATTPVRFRYEAGD